MSVACAARLPTVSLDLGVHGRPADLHRVLSSAEWAYMALPIVILRIQLLFPAFPTLAS